MMDADFQTFLYGKMCTLLLKQLLYAYYVWKLKGL